MIHSLSFIDDISGKSGDHFIEKKNLLLFNKQINLYSILSYILLLPSQVAWVYLSVCLPFII